MTGSVLFLMKWTAHRPPILSSVQSTVLYKAHHHHHYYHHQPSPPSQPITHHPYPSPLPPKRKKPHSHPRPRPEMKVIECQTPEWAAALHPGPLTGFIGSLAAINPKPSPKLSEAYK
ncbi:hypothetical protein BO86DRAFT_141393 [Aspergillus japonicus CBS 114.51]|uniref:Uncharacterized protein n=1 Tax=Aspergillus japonicus CBS 114.51 TaxID=1448312 RepID=A0A8T8XDQ9_ASPJA|nr:hypothetical protein BO86DRAFT_141393 [Aspergillus japonicus CBS 114.51]RAH86285.1 hypothetical protein BO86DRAFT_141393 [Aspergillus japonicus CBS 114.51]